MITCILGAFWRAAMFTGRFLLRSSRTMVTSSSRAKDLSALRPSASLVVVNSSNEVLLVHRNPNATSFAGMHVRNGLDRYSRSVGAPTRWLIPSWHYAGLPGRKL